MKRTILLFSLLFLFVHNYAQKYDLIITTRGNSIACNIDSITDTKIYFDFKMKYSSVQTFLNIEDVSKIKEDTLSKKDFVYRKGNRYISLNKINELSFDTSQYQHAHQLFLSPSSFGLKKGDFYYKDFFAVHNIQYGISNRLSLDLGVSFILYPVYFTLNYSLPVSDNLRMSFINYSFFNTWEGFSPDGNIAYINTSYGNISDHINIGVGYAYITERFRGNSTHSPFFLFSAHRKVGKRSYFITESVLLTMESTYHTYNTISPIYDTYRYKTTLIGNLTGIRIVTKKKMPLRTWQFGLGALLMIDGKVPNEFSSSEWNNHSEDGTVQLIPMPTISFTQKLGKVYNRVIKPWF